MPFCVDTIKALINVCSSAHPTSAAVVFFSLLCFWLHIKHIFHYSEKLCTRDDREWVFICRSDAWKGKEWLCFRVCCLVSSPFLLLLPLRWRCMNGETTIRILDWFFPLSLSLVMMGLTNSTGRMVGYDGRVSWGKIENQAFRRRRQQFGNETQPPRCVSPKHSVGGCFHSPISDSIQYN